MRKPLKLGTTMREIPIDRRTTRGRELAQRFNAQTILENMPKIYFVRDDYANNYRVGRTDWPGDVFNIVSNKDFAALQRVLTSLDYPLEDKTHDDE